MPLNSGHLLQFSRYSLSHRRKLPKLQQYTITSLEFCLPGLWPGILASNAIAQASLTHPELNRARVQSKEARNNSSKNIESMLVWRLMMSSRERAIERVAWRTGQSRNLNWLDIQLNFHGFRVLNKQNENKQIWEFYYMRTPSSSIHSL